MNDTYRDDGDETDCQFCAKETKCTNKIFHIFDVLLGFMILLDSFVLFAEMGDFIGFILPVYFMFIGFFIMVLSFWVPKLFNAYCPFYFTFLGRGISYLLLGSVILVFEHGYSLTVGSMTIIMAFVYFSFAVYAKWFALDGTKAFCINLPEPIYQPDPEHGENDNVHDKAIEIGQDEDSTTDESNHRDRDRQIKANKDIDRALTMAIESGDGVVIDDNDVNDNENLHHL